MTHILLTGAGFSHNWGGWLASEAFEYLLGSKEIDAETRKLLWRSKENGGGFEDTFADLTIATDKDSKKRLSDLTSALVAMFYAMTQGFAGRQFEFQTDREYMVQTFLLRFDAIFTLNQDTLLESHYLGMKIGNRWIDCGIPGVKAVNANALIIQRDRTEPHEPDNSVNFKISPTSQPYFKLHGSCNWTEGAGRILIMGGQKAIAIDQFPLLNWYHAMFKQYLSRQEARLMVIGYSFSDKHINDAIADGVERGLQLFIIDPRGVDVLDKRPKEPVGRGRDEYMDKLAPNIIGASRRPLTSTFRDDAVEHGRLMKFFD